MPVKVHGPITGSVEVTKERGYLIAVLVGTDGVNDATLTVYNRKDGNMIIPTCVIPGGLGLGGAAGLAAYCEDGVTVSLTGTGATASIHYKPLTGTL
jgi:hypothetical protein